MLLIIIGIFLLFIQMIFVLICLNKTFKKNEEMEMRILQIEKRQGTLENKVKKSLK